MPDEKMKSALVTGTSKGLGLELSKALLARGYRVIGVSRSNSQIEHDNYSHLSADITDMTYPQTLSDFVERCHVHHLDILVNNAGVRSHGSNIEEVTAEEIMRQFQLHCVAALSTIQALMPWLEQSKIINITSRLGSVEFNQRGDFIGNEFSYGYRIAKAAQNMLSLCLSVDEKLSGNVIVSIIPGLLRTDSGTEEAKTSAADGAKAVLEKILEVDVSGVYHAFEDEAAY